MASSSKKVRKDQKKRERAKREAAKEKRQQLRAAKEPKDVLESSLLVTDQTDAEQVNPANPEIVAWWDRYLQGDGKQRLSMIRAKLGEELDDEWREAIFPESIYEAEAASKPKEYVAFLETLASEDRDLYQENVLWFLHSRVTHYLAIGEHDKIEAAVKQDSASMTETRDAFFGIMPMLRLAGLATAADTLATAGFGVLDNSVLMSWAYDEVFHFFVDSHVRRCVDDGGDAKAIAQFESALEEMDADMDPSRVLMRGEMIRRLVGRTKTKWTRNQLVGTNQESSENRWLLSFEFSRWLVVEHGITAVAADELRGLILEPISGDILTMQSYLNGIPRSALDQHLVSMLGFMSLSRFKAPATLIAAEHFVRFLSEAGLVNDKQLKRSLDTIINLDAQLRLALASEWSSFTFLEPLRTFDENI